MKVFIRADASIEIGTGHVMRCLTLAEELKSKGATVTFICRKLEGDLIHYIEKRGFHVHSLPSPINNKFEKDKMIKHSHWLKVDWETDVEQTNNILTMEKEIEWLIIDHYAIDIKWENKVRNLVKKIMVIDDLADRFHDCDLLLDQNLIKGLETRYDKWVSNHCIKLLGPQFALLRNEFREASKLERKRDGTVKRVFIFFGGSDPTNETTKVLRSLKKLNRNDLAVDVVVGGANQKKEEIKHLCTEMTNVHFYYEIDFIAELMTKADIAIGAGGTTTWERCSLGLPSLVTIIAENQEEIVNAATKKKAIINMGKFSNVTENMICNLLTNVLNDKKLLMELSMNAKKLMDPYGTERVVTYLIMD